MGLGRRLERWGRRGLVAAISRIHRVEKVPAERILEGGVAKVLVVRQHHLMGDTLLAVPALRAIRESLPGVFLGFLGTPVHAPLFRSHPYVDRFHCYDKGRPWTLPGLIRELRTHRYDLAVVLNTVSFSVTSALLGWAAGARRLVGVTSRPFGHRLSSALYHMELPLPAPEELRGMSESEHNLVPLRALGIDTSDLSPLVDPGQEARRWAETVVGPRTAGSKRLAVHPGARKPENVWPPERFAEVVTALEREFALETFVVEGPKDRPYVERYRRRRPGDRWIRGEPIDRVAALFERMDLVLCNDTGVMHVAAGVGVRTVALFGPTDPTRWAPRSDRLLTVRAPGGEMDALDVSRVLEAARRWLVEEGSEGPAQGDPQG
jgi:ADP-heptose:LPS heptosyltransferase